MSSGIIQLILLLLFVGLSLLPFFQWFRGTPHQLAAIKELEQSLPEELLDEDAECRPFRGGLQSLRLAWWRRCLWRGELSLDEDAKSRPFREADAELADESDESSDS